MVSRRNERLGDHLVGSIVVHAFDKVWIEPRDRGRS